MTQRDTILNELRELESTLLTASSLNMYQVPGGYFEGFAEQVMRRIKALEAGDTHEELSILSPVINSVERTTPYKVPLGYFDGLEKKLLQTVLQNDTQQTAEEELESLSPLLSGLKKQNLYTVPDNYFESLSTNGSKKINRTEAKVISLGASKWFRYAAAAVITGVIAVSAVFLLKKDSINPVDKSFAWVEKSLKQVSTDDLDQFIDMSEEQSPVIASITPGKEVKELMSNLTEEELQHFLDDVKEAEPNSDDDILLN
jgi:hypothetical protein